MTFALDVIVRSTIVLVAATILCLLLSRASASTRHAVWLTALLSAIALPLASRLLPSINFPVPVKQEMVAAGGNHRSLVVTTGCRHFGYAPELVWLCGDDLDRGRHRDL